MHPEARRALDCGEYRKVVSLLEPLRTELPASNAKGAELRLWLATAYQGLNDQASAVSCCREVILVGGGEQRRQAQAVLAIIEAPVLQRPKEWSIELPHLGDSPPLEGLARGAASRGRAKKELPKPAPPVGKTKAPIGFALFAGLFLLCLTLLLAGCMRVDSSIEFHGPGRLEFQQQLQGQPASRSGVLTLEQLTPLIGVELQRFEQRYGIEVQEPEINWRGRNWLVGVQQQMQLSWDLRALDPVPGLFMHLHFRPLAPRAVELAEPLMPEAEGTNGLDWQLLPGQLNRFEFSCWRWSGLGLGALATGFLLATSLLLQHRLLKAPTDLDRSPNAPL